MLRVSWQKKISLMLFKIFFISPFLEHPNPPAIHKYSMEWNILKSVMKLPGKFIHLLKASTHFRFIFRIVFPYISLKHPSCLLPSNEWGIERTTYPSRDVWVCRCMFFGVGYCKLFRGHLRICAWNFIFLRYWIEWISSCHALYC